MPRLLGHRIGFTMLELTLVIGLIVVLTGLTIIVANSVTRGAKVTQCRQILAVLDATLTDYEAEKGGMPLWTPDDYRPPIGFTQGGRERPEVAVYLQQAMGYPEINKKFSAIDPQFFLKRAQIYSDLLGSEDVAGHLSTGNPDDRPSMRDPWGMEILYVHPLNKDATDVYGKCINGRPYFMSSGPDYLYDTIQDDIYSYTGIAPDNAKK